MRAVIVIPACAVLLFIAAYICVPRGCRRDPQKRAAGLDMAAIANAVDMYQVKSGRLPARLEDLVPTHITTIRLDPWGRAYAYEISGEGYCVRSRGPDGELGTDDDISSDVFRDLR